ncbi:S8 family serine peptidase [Reichenbachiella sp.]|uniref:S8 family serine peptidase n=1 Tax=Reichenbachiella sp. TaxID=2184521 RepID=UPI003B5BC312
MNQLKLLILCLLTALNLSAQSVSSEHPLFQNKIVLNSSSQEASYISVIENGRSEISVVPSRKSLESDYNGEYIVKFKGSPRPNSASRSTDNSLLNDEVISRFGQFKKDIQALGSSSRSNEQSFADLKQEYYKAFYGAHMKLSQNMLNEIRELPYVEYVKEVKKYTASLDETIALVKADQIWETYNTKGEGITVGIIDTGIDYMHPALGEGFGAGYKVEGGYDFVNNDADPIDDHNHGTHVAGIVAANGDGLIGVAPEATLYALKALDSYGSGYDFQIIAAIEWSVDPNGDNNPSDKLDVVNMSLGGSGDAYDPLSEAVNAAVEMGVVFCVAAGNDYDFWQIGSPGTAELAITVGASNNYGELAGFSSKGPANGSFAIKPDLLAPGVNINSSVTNGGTSSYDGTSMATPHVAGLAALLLDVHPSWTPEIVKSALVTTAESIGEEVMAEGSGQVDGMNAIQATSLLSLTNLSFGKNEINEAIWENKLDLTITNTGIETENYAITDIDVISGITLIPSVYNFAVQPGNSASIEFTLKVDNAVFEMTSTPTRSYSDVINIQTNSKSIVLPWSFMSTSELTVMLDDPNYWVDVYVYNDDELIWDWNSGDTDRYDGITFKVPNGTYDVLAYNWDRDKFVLKENVEVSKSSTVEISKKNVTRKIDYSVQIEDGITLSEKFKDSDSYFTNAILVSPQGYSFGIYGGSFENVRSSNFSSNYVLELKAGVKQYQADHPQIYEVYFPNIKGLENDVSLIVEKSEIQEKTVIIDFPTDNLIDEIILFDYEYEVTPNGNYLPIWGGGNSIENIGVKSWSFSYFGNEQKMSSDSTIKGLTPSIYMEGGDQNYRIDNIAIKNGALGSIKDASNTQFFPGGSDAEVVVFGRGLFRPVYYERRESAFPSYFTCQLGADLTDLYHLYYYGIGSNDYSCTGTLFWYDELISYEHYIYSVVGSSDPAFSPIRMHQLYLTDASGVVVPKLNTEGEGKLRFTLSNGSRSITSSKIVITNESETLSESFEAIQIGKEDSLFTFEVDIKAKEFGDHLSLEIFAIDSEEDSMRYVLGSGLDASANHIPQIIDQNHVSVAFDEPYDLLMGDLKVVDKDHIYPFDHEISIQEDDHSLYTVSGHTITPTTDNKQAIDVNLNVSDRIDESEVFHFQLLVGNEKPEITGQKTVYVTLGESYEFSIEDLYIEDLDNTFPDDFSVEFVEDIWNKYYFERIGNSFTPVNYNNNFVRVPIRIFDGMDFTPIYYFEIYTRSSISTFEIVGQEDVIIERDSVFTMSMDYLKILDPEGEFPDNFSMTLNDSYGIEIDGDEVYVTSESMVDLYLNVEVSNSSSDKQEYYFNIKVKDKPKINCSPYKVIDMGSYTTIDTWDLCIESYKPWYEVYYTIHEGENYTVSGSDIYPDENFYGTLSVKITANDGELDSDPAYVTVVVQHTYSHLVPKIDGQKDISIKPNESRIISLEDLYMSNLKSSDKDYSIELSEGDDYSFEGNTVIPAESYLGKLLVPIRVVYHSTEAGDLFSNKYTVAIQVEEEEELLLDAPINHHTIVVYPNPVENELRINVDNVKHVSSVSLVHVSGKEISELKTQNAGDNVIRVDVSSVRPGLYVLMIETSIGRNIQRVRIK